jgi:DNA-directed RNA polymerase specialized sigma24 family protein
MMSRSPGGPDHHLGPFPTTHWSIVGRAGMGDSARRRALAALLTQYLPALRLYLLAGHRVPADRADDLLQGFLADKVVAQDLVRRADRERGRFRSFLIAALDRFVIDQVRHDKAARRSPGAAVSLDQNPVPDPPAARAPDVFDRAWARQVLELATGRTRQECGAAGRDDVWAVFDARVLGPTLHGRAPVPLGELVARFGFTPEQASNLLVTGKRMFARNLRGVVGEYAEEADVEEEVRLLRRVIAGPGA